MTSPWLQVPLDDYEGHMSAPQVGQLQVLAELFDEVLRLRRPHSVAVLGIAGGNGLDRLDPSLTRRVLGIDINPAYLEQVRHRYPILLELHCLNLAKDRIALEPVDLVHAALVFEHAGVELCLENALALVHPHTGALSVVLQLPSDSAAAVGVSPFPSLHALAPQFRFVAPASMTDVLKARGLNLIHQRERHLPGGKRFWAAMFSA